MGVMRTRFQELREEISSSLWAIPTTLAILACILSALTLSIDELDPNLRGLRPWLFGGSASAARDLLSSIAGSLITVAALAFSTTIIAIQQASTQFSPRVIRNFMRDRVNQSVFGTYIATFVYALLILRQVRADSGPGDEFIPALSVTLGLVLALICVGLLIFFIHHTASSLQVSTITEAIRQDLRVEMERQYPFDIAMPAYPDGRPLQLPPIPPTQRVPAPDAGFLRQIDVDSFLDSIPATVDVVRLLPQVGDYIFQGATLIELWGNAPLTPEASDRLTSACPVGKERSIHQDLLFGIRQLTDIALKALSPGINDPTTAENCLSHLGDAVAQLAGRPFPHSWRWHRESEVLLFLNRPDFGAVVEAAFGQIRRECADDLHVTNYLLATLEEIATRIEATDRADAIRQQTEEVLAALEGQVFTNRDRAAIRERADGVFAALDRATSGSLH